MSKTKEQKKKIVESLVDKLTRMKSAVFVNFSGLKVKDAQRLREKTWEREVDYGVVKKTLLNIALKQSALEDIDAKSLQGNIGMVLGYDDEITAPKLAAEFSKENNALKILGGILEKKFVDAARMKSLAILPSRLELLGQLLRGFQSPITGFVNVLQGNLRRLVQVLNALKESKS